MLNDLSFIIIHHQIIFEGITGTSYRGDIAIDDVMVTDGPCPDPGNCDFERDLCGYTNRPYLDQFDWMLGNGKTSSVYTGPKTDHTIGDGTGINSSKFLRSYVLKEGQSKKKNETGVNNISRTVVKKKLRNCI